MDEPYGESYIREEVREFKFLSLHFPFSQFPVSSQEMGCFQESEKKTPENRHDFIMKSSGSSSVSFQFSPSVPSDSLRPHEPQHNRPPCFSPTPGVHLNPCPLSQWCHPTIASSVSPFSSGSQFFPATGSFQMNQLFTSSGQSVGILALTSALPKNIQYWSPLGWTG